MSTPVYLFFGIRDEALRTATAYYRASDELSGDDFAAFFTLVHAVSGGHQIAHDVQRAQIDDDGQGSSDGPYGTAGDIAVLDFQLTDGRHARVSIPAPLDIFLEDHETVDESIPDVAALIAEILSLPLVVADGTEFSEYVRGWRAQTPDFSP